MGEIRLGCADARVVVEGDRGQPFASVSGAYLLGIQCVHVQPLQRQPYILCASNNPIIFVAIAGCLCETHVTFLMYMATDQNHRKYI